MSKVKENEINLKFIEDFKKNMEGKLEPSVIDDAVEKLFFWENKKYPAIGIVESFIFYIRFDIIINTDKKHFQGNAGGLTTPGIGSVFGNVHTDDLVKLYSDTVSFAFHATAITFNVLFFNSYSQTLGYFSGGAISIVSGIGGGTGSWS
ncbi:virulence-associated protein [Xenorhabdus cabanillasii]|uniref:Virulence-associated protein n=1 Tax=Xenorhabdus cabanillasii TaxID=351673 RepID=A0A3D9UKU7_9GAMM|nr:VapA/VapB family virulence-associated protein [Xenorhabdus cabanillasii]REF28550.1 virulence-associated protein [Xenorhabdus cabanillasii]